MSDLVGSVTEMADYAGATPSAQAWFAGGERVGYDPKARAIVAAQNAHCRQVTVGFRDAADSQQVWAPEAICPELAAEYAQMGPRGCAVEKVPYLQFQSVIMRYAAVL
jgi:hypothetical protein